MEIENPYNRHIRKLIESKWHYALINVKDGDEFDFDDIRDIFKLII